MKKLLSGGHYKIFLARILFAFILFTLTRILFFIFFHEHFGEIGFGDFMLIIFYGLRFDLSAIIVFYSIFIFFSIIPFHLKSKRIYQTMLLVIFIIPTAIAMAGNLLDCVYFGFTLSRTTADIFNVIALGSDFSTLLPQYIRDFWYAFLIWVVLILLAVLFFLKTKIVSVKTKTGSKLLLAYLKESLFFIIISAIGIIGVRGGFQLRPISIMTAGQYASAKNVALVLNTPFTIMKTFGKSGVKNVEYFDNKTLDKIYSPVHLYLKKDHPQKKNNVIVIVLESFSKEYIGELNKNLDDGRYKGYTPFLDSLIRESLVFTNAYSNGKRSIESIPAILAGIPSLMNDAYITSMYSGNNINSLATTLNENGYTSAFFHGGTNGTMGFDNFSKLAGFDRYYGRSEYNNEKDFDGKWGIYDEEFLQYAADKLDQTTQPFIAAIFTLSSHHPYKIPDKYLSKFPKGKRTIHQSIMYTDFALKKFFQKISQKPWFDSTLFVITADHTSESLYPQYQTRSGMYAVPILFYQHNSNLKGENKMIVQQTDIMPSILDYLNFNKKFIAFGESVFDTSALHFAINYVNETYQLIYKNYALIFDGTSGISFYNIEKDSLMKIDLHSTFPSEEKELERKIKAIIQSYNLRLIKNEMVTI
ncbi:MAG: sulfatase-like hydrolase/transferase [Bacteroidales bacterium]